MRTQRKGPATAIADPLEAQSQTDTSGNAVGHGTQGAVSAPEVVTTLVARWYVNAPVHPVNTLPMMSDAELDELAADIKKNGLQEPITYWMDNREAANGEKG